MMLLGLGMASGAFGGPSNDRARFVWRAFDLVTFDGLTQRLPCLQTLSRVTRQNVDTNSLSVVLIFCGIGLLISLVAIFCGFDFSDVLL
jgi:hypothetical protein